MDYLVIDYFLSNARILIRELYNTLMQYFRLDQKPVESENLANFLKRIFRPSDVGTPQGDSLSPVLFTVYLEHTFKEGRPTLPRPTTSFEAEILNEVAQADDVDFIGQNYADIKKIQEVLK